MGASYLAAQEKTPFRPFRLAHSSTGETQLVSVRGGAFWMKNNCLKAYVQPFPTDINQQN